MVGDENPSRRLMIWREALGKALEMPIRLVDADVVVPTSLFPKEEFAARTLRPKIHRVWDEYLKPITNPQGPCLPGSRAGHPPEARRSTPTA